ncbi:ABC transporter permease subunit [Nonomuraea salmonea]|uniref:ABC transporter permease subunit n=1 Tax=Nonomuraea salmonea TaxID=46181 RepID=UPI002FED6CDA
MSAFVNQLPIGLSIGAVLLLIALGLTFTFGQMGVINMAHGEFIMAGAYTAFLLQDLVLALPVAFLVAGVMGLILERAAIRHFYGRPLDTLLLTWGVSLVLQQLARDLFGAPNVQVPAPSWLAGGVGILPYNRLFIMALAVAGVVGGSGRTSRAPAWAAGPRPWCRTGSSPPPAASTPAGWTC